MRSFLSKCPLVCLLVLMESFATASTSAILLQNVATVPEGVVRKVAKTIVRPTYPPTSKKHGIQGLAVVSVDINEYGDVTEVAVVEAPDEEIGQSVTSAVKQWKCPCG